jgi:hypothetical protein
MVMSEFFFLPALLFCLPSCLPRCTPRPPSACALPATACAASTCARPKTTKYVSQNGGGVEYVNKNHFDLILGVDIQPPGMNSYLEYKFVPATLMTLVRYPNQLM